VKAVLPSKLILLLGSCFGLGYCPVASGTVTVAAAGLPLFWAVWRSSLGVQVALFVIMTLVAVWLSGAGDRILGEQDSRKMVADEIVGYQLAVLGLPFTWQLVVASFVVERAIDIIKVPPAPWIERRVPGGWGVVLDDVVAGAYTQLLLRAVLLIHPALLGV
jgi:phosphatidylglycerophosphatase A